MVPENCSVHECRKAGPFRRGLCGMHYARLLRHGSPGTAEKQHAVSWAGKACQIDGCGKPVLSLGYCTPHYKRLRKYGDPLGKPVKPTTSERFWSKVDKSGDCWTWTGGQISSGYGAFHPVQGETIPVHRYVYANLVGEIPEGFHVDHRCHNDTDCPPGPCPHRLCVNPAHLEAVPPQVNVNRSHNSNIRKTHCPRGHEYTPENTRTQIKSYGEGRKCKTCEREGVYMKSLRKAAA